MVAIISPNAAQYNACELDMLVKRTLNMCLKAIDRLYGNAV